MNRTQCITVCMLLFSLLCTRAQETSELTLCWDVSGSMQQRDLGREMDFLSSYFNQRPNASVTLLIFSNSIWEAEQFEIRDGIWGELQNRLQALPFDGATSLKELPAYSNGDEILLFTDGRQNMEGSTPAFDGRVYIINSNPFFDHANLNLLALLNNAELVNLAEKTIQTEMSPHQPYFGKIFGHITDYSTVTLRVRGESERVYHPDSLGYYSVPAIPGDTLMLEVNRRLAVKQELSEARNINIWLEDSGEIRLEEVVVTNSPAGGEPLKVETALGYKNRDAVGYTAPEIGSSQINDVETDASSAIQGKFSGVRLGQSDRLSQVEIRSKWSVLGNNYGLVVIDGVPMARAGSGVNASGDMVQKAGFIDPKNIAGITVLKGLAATNRFGSLGANGVILITTKTASFNGAGNREKKDLALLKDNIYDGRIRVNKESLTTDYLRELREGKDVSGAYELYLSQRRKFEDKEAYYIDVYDYFRESNPGLAFRILSNILEKSDAGYPALRALLFKAREMGDGEFEHQVAQRLLQEHPDKVQSYLDLAGAQQRAGLYQPALGTLLAMLSGEAGRELDFTPLQKTVERDLANLVAMHSPGLNLDKVPAKNRNNIQYNARIRFEWNKPEAAFSIQFVNPQKRFFTWEHGEYADIKRLKSELEHGYGTEEFEIFGPGVQGEWIINIKYNGNANPEADDPLFINCTITRNFGKPGQESRDYVLRLQDKGSETQLAKIKLE